MTLRSIGWNRESQRVAGRTKLDPQRISEVCEEASTREKAWVAVPDSDGNVVEGRLAIRYATALPTPA